MIKDNASLFSAVVSGVVNAAATLVAVYGTDRWGRRKLFLEGGIQMLLFQVILLFPLSELTYDL